MQVDECRWDGEIKKWKVEVTVMGRKDREFIPAYTIMTDFLVSSVSQLNYPQYPNIIRLQKFKGKMMHSTRGTHGHT